MRALARLRFNIAIMYIRYIRYVIGPAPRVSILYISWARLYYYWALWVLNMDETNVYIFWLIIIVELCDLGVRIHDV